MVRVAILADAPTLTTGFGRTTRHIAGALSGAGARVDVFGLKARASDAAVTSDGYRIWPAEQGGHWSETLSAFFAARDPDVLVLNMDAYNALECLERCADAGWQQPTVSYVCFDGLPVAELYLEAQRRCAAVWCSSRGGARFLRDQGIEVAGVATPGVDLEEFRPVADRRALRARAGLERQIVVGAFATNTERKQLARVVEGFAAARERLSGDATLYLHSGARGHCDLLTLARECGVADCVLFPDAEAFDECRGLPPLDYVERINLCNVIVNMPHSGDYEQVILEAQACGIPLVHTADGAIMSEALGDGGLALTGTAAPTGRAGQQLQLVEPAAVAEAIVQVVCDQSLRDRLIEAGRANAARYDWDVLEQAAHEMVAPFVPVGGR